jgi:type III pantothenate kinase
MTAPAGHRAVLIDAGNSKIRVVAWRGGREDRAVVGCGCGHALPAAAALTEWGRCATPAGGGETGRLAVWLQETLAPLSGLPVVLTSVVPELVLQLRNLLPGLIVVDHTSTLPFKLALDEPAAVGSDRLCNVAAAAASGCGSALVVDAGTATTFDLLMGGEFVGGLIAPGMAFAASCLAQSAARLFPVPFEACGLEAGSNTASAMQAGCYHAGVGGVEAVVTGLLAKYGPLPVVVTGGLGYVLARSGRLHDPDWTLRGAAVLAELGA